VKPKDLLARLFAGVSDYSYACVHTEEDAVKDLTPEERLWATVIERAFLDAKGVIHGVGDNDAVKVRLQKEAYRWFKDGGEDFKEVCTMAGLNHAFVREKALKLVAVKHLKEVLKLIKKVQKADGEFEKAEALSALRQYVEKLKAMTAPSPFRYAHTPVLSIAVGQVERR